jgi:hypothetical protein
VKEKVSRMAQMIIMMLELGPLLSQQENNIVQTVEKVCKGLVMARSYMKVRCKAELERKPLRMIC